MSPGWGSRGEVERGGGGGGEGVMKGEVVRRRSIGRVQLIIDICTGYEVNKYFHNSELERPEPDITKKQLR